MGLIDKLAPFVPQAAIALAERGGFSRDAGVMLVVSSTVVLTAVLTRRLLAPARASPARASPAPEDAGATTRKDGAGETGSGTGEENAAGHVLADGTRVDFSGSWAKDEDRCEDYAAFEQALGTPPEVKMMTAGLSSKKVNYLFKLLTTNYP